MKKHSRVSRALRHVRDDVGDSIKILHVINGLDLGGAETALYRLVQAMQGRSYSFAVIVLSQPGYYSEKIKSLGIPIYYLEIKQGKRLKAFFRLIRCIRNVQPDIVQTWLYHSDFMGGICAKLCGVKKIVWSVRCEGLHLKLTTKWVQRVCAILSWIIPNCIVTNSQAALQNHIRMGYCAKKMRVIYNGFDTHLFVPTDIKKNLPTHFSLPHDSLLIGTLARFHADKNYLGLMQIIDPICSQYKQAYFIFCGQGCDEDNVQLKTGLAKLFHQDRVILIGATNQAEKYLNQLDIFILASRTESFPNSLAEAMACGLACIATDVGEARHLLGDAGFIVQANDPKQLAAACLSMLAKTQEERKQYGLAARRKIEESYSLTCHVAQMQEIYAGKGLLSCVV